MPTCIGCECEVPEGNFCPACWESYQRAMEQEPFIPTPEDEELLHKDMMDPALFGDLAIPVDHEVEPLNGKPQDLPEHWRFN